MQFLQICQLHIYAANLLFYRIPIGFRSGKWKATEEHVHETRLRRLVLCDMAHYHAGSSH